MLLQFCVWGHGGGCSSSCRPSCGGASCCGSWSLLLVTLQSVGQLCSRSRHTSGWPRSAACSQQQHFRAREAGLASCLAAGSVPYAKEWLRHRRGVSGQLCAAAAVGQHRRVRSKQHGAVASPHLEFGGTHKRRPPGERSRRRGGRRGWHSAAAQRQTGLEMFDEAILTPSETREDSVTMDTNTHQSSVSSCVPLVWLCSLLDQRLDFLQVSVQSCRPDTCTRAHTNTRTHRHGHPRVMVRA